MSLYPIYLDNNATTALDPIVLKAMLEDLEGGPFNPSSIHSFGQRARQKLVKATQSIASYFNVSPQEIIYTSGATEALNMLILGVSLKKNGGHIVTSTLEHAAVFNCVQKLKDKKQVQVTFLAPHSGQGAITLEQVEAATNNHTHTIILMAANNETGALTDIDAIATFAMNRGISLIVDGVALLGKVSGFHKKPLHPGISAICFSGHKIHGPKGIGLAVVRKSLKWEPSILGGSQQNGRRGGTENLAGILGFAKAIDILREESDRSIDKMAALRNRFEKELQLAIPDLKIHCTENRVCNTSNIAFLGVDGESLLMKLDLHGIAASHGSACQSGGLEPSRVLMEMGLSSSIAKSSIRFSLSKYTTESEIDHAIKMITECVNTLRRSLNSVSSNLG